MLLFLVRFNSDSKHLLRELMLYTLLIELDTNFYHCPIVQ